MAFVCSRCADQKVTGKLLCKQVLRNDLFKLINSFNRCKGCDGRENAVKFKTTIRKLPVHIFPQTVKHCKEMLRDKHLKKYINSYTLCFLKDLIYVYFTLLNNKDLKYLRKTTIYTYLKYRINTNMKSYLKKPPTIELEELAFRFFSDYFQQYLDKSDADYMIKMLKQIFDK